MRRPRVSLAWYSVWVGVYWDRFDRTLYVCPLPCLVFSWEFNR